MNREGYIRIHRSLLDWEWYGDEAVTVLFLHLLLTVNWKPGNFRGMEVPAGTVITSLDKLADTFGWSRGKLRRTIDKLKRTGEATSQTTNHWTAITLVNWAKYQNNDQQSGQPTDQQPANNRPTIGQQSATIEEGKKERRKEVNVTPRRPSTSKWSKEDFKAQCADVVKDNPERLPRDQRGPFFDYWTEADANGKMRFQDEKFFDVGRRMDTWKRNNFFKPGHANGGPMSKADADRALDDLRAKHGIAPGCFIETHLIPKDVLEAIRRP